LTCREPRQLECLRFGDRAGAHAAEEEAEECLSRGWLVEHSADELCVRRTTKEGLESRTGELHPLEVEARDGRVPRDELRGVEDPALKEAACEGVADVSEVGQPSRVDRDRVLFALRRGEQLCVTGVDW